MMKNIGFGISVLLAMTSFGALAGEAACDVQKGFDVSADDFSRLARLESSRSKGLASALVYDNQSEREIISGLFSNGFAPLKNLDGLIGRYQCRTIKLGGNLPAIVYGWFSCEIFPEEAAMIVHKTSGSQRFFGLLSPAGNGAAYRGALHYGYEDQVKFYGQETERNQVGCLSAVGPDLNHFVLELPEPIFESQHDVIEFVRTN